MTIENKVVASHVIECNGAFDPENTWDIEKHKKGKSVTRALINTYENGDVDVRCAFYMLGGGCVALEKKGVPCHYYYSPIDRQTLLLHARDRQKLNPLKRFLKKFYGKEGE